MAETDTGIFIYGDYQRGPYASAAGTLIAGNIIGLAADGETAAGFGNQYDGIVIDSAPNTTIGGTVAAARNIISNNTNNQGAGILITNFEEPDGAYGTVVQGNYIGTDITGTEALGNDIGIDIEGASSSLIGTDGQDGAADALEGNLISGNLTAGIIINAASAFVGGGTTIPGAVDNVVGGNMIGTNLSGTAALGNAIGVILAGGTTGNTIGGTAAGAGQPDQRQHPLWRLDRQLGWQYRRGQPDRDHHHGRHGPAQQRAESLLLQRVLLPGHRRRCGDRGLLLFWPRLWQPGQ